jgi:hypothetical protein
LRWASRARFAHAIAFGGRHAVLAGIDPARLNQLADELEDEAIVARAARQ